MAIKKKKTMSSTSSKPSKPPTDIYAVVRIFQMHFKIIGITTLSKIVTTTGKTIYTKQKMNIINLTMFLLRTSVAAYFLYETFNDVYKHREPITKVMYLVCCLSAHVTMLTSLLNSSVLTKTLDKINEVDKTLKMHSYEHWIILSATLIFICSAIVIVFYIIKFLTDDPMSVLTEYFSFAQGLITLTLVLIFVNVLLLIVRERFQRLNQLLNEHDNDITFYAKQKSKKYSAKKEIEPNFLNLMTDLHYQLCECAILINDTFTVSLFFCVHIVYGEIIYGSYAIKYPFDSIVKDVHFILFCTIVTLQLISVLICCHLTEKEAEATFYLLGDITVCYYDESMALTRNTLLLQGLHYKIDFNACHVYPLNLGILAEEISTITTIVLFLID